MANLSNINNKFIVTDGGQALVNQTVSGFNPDADDLIVGNLSGNTGITIASGSSAGNYGSIYFADGAGSSTASKAGYIRYEQNTSKMTIGINAVEKVAIDLNGNSTFAGNVQAPSVLANNFIEIRSDTAALYFENAANNNYYRLQRTSNDLYLDYYNGSSTTTYTIVSSAGEFWSKALFAGAGTGYRRTYLQEGGFRCTSSSDEASTLDIAVDNTKTQIYSNYYSGGSNNDICISTYPPSQNQLYLKNTGNIGIGTDSPGQKLEVYQAATNSQAYVTVQNNRSRNAAVLTQTTNGGFYTGTSIGTDTLCWQVYDASAGERMRIDSNGAVGIGANNVSYRLRIKSDATVDNGIYLSAGTNFTNHSLYIENRDGNQEQFAITGDGEIRLNATSGHTYAAQGIRFGANASANNLDDYEEGTWDPQIAMSASTISVSYSYKLGTYTKIGRMVMAMFDLNATVSGTISGFASVNGLPFTVGSSVAGGGGMAGYSVAQWRSSSLFNAGGANQQIKGFPNQNTTYIYCQLDDSGTTGFSGGAGASWKTGVAGRVTGYTMYFVN